MKKSIIVFALALVTTSGFAKVKKAKIGPDKALDLIRVYENLGTSKSDLLTLKEQTLKMGTKAVPTLVKVMKTSKFDEKKRWVATFALGRIMGKKSAPFISKFSGHPHWMLRLASLKTLLALKQNDYGNIYRESLKDKALMVRMQALQNIKLFNMKEYGPEVWKMMFHKHNYMGKKGKLKRTAIIGQVIQTVGDLKYAKATKPLLKLIKNKKYNDVYFELEYALQKLTGKMAPAGDIKKKRAFWSKLKV